MRVRLNKQSLTELLARSARSQNAWAIRVGVSRGHWSDLVNGKHPYPSPKTREQMLDALGVPFEDLFEIESPNSEADTALKTSLAQRYIIDREIGAGAMGVVYLARDIQFGRQVAIKMVFAEAVGGLDEHFVTEVRNTAQLQHPNILPLFDAGEIDGRPYYVTPYVAQGSLRDLIEHRGALNVEEALPIVRNIVAALDYAHGKDVLHCDVKPENILLTGDHAYVADFGLSRAVHMVAVREWDRPPEVDIGAGTPAYVSPERARAELHLDPRSDVYSLACVVFEMLSGQTPFRGGSTTEIVKRRFDSVPPDLRLVAPRLPAALASVLAAAMSPDREHRPAAAGQFLRRLELAATTAAVPVSGDTSTAAHTALTAITSWALTRRSTPRASLMQNLFDDLRYSMRSLRRKPLFAVVAIITLALGIGANAAIFSVVNGVLLRPLPYPEPERLIRIYSQFEGRTCCPISTPNFLDLRSQVSQLEDMVSYGGGMFAISGDGDPVRMRGLYVTHGYFEMLGAEPQVGRLIGQVDDQFGGESVVVISDRLWQDRYGASEDVVGQSINIDSVPHTVIGVAPQEFREGQSTQLYVPFAWDPNDLPSRNSNSNSTLARLAPGATVESALAELSTLYAAIVKLYPDVISNDGIGVRRLSEATVGDRDRGPLLMLWGAVGMVLLVACANVVNLMLARAESRHRELAVRSALGATRGQIVRHFLTESLAVSLIGGLVGVLSAYGGLRLLLGSYSDAIPRSGGISVDTSVLLFSLLVSIVTGVAVGLLPALWHRSGDLAAELSESSRGQVGGQRRLREALVVLEVAMALILVIGAGLMLKSFWRLSQVDVGVDPTSIVSARVSLPAARYPEPVDRLGFYDALADRLRALPSVEEVGLASHVPFDGSHSNFSRVWPVTNPDVGATFVEARVVDSRFFATLGLDIQAGRSFEPTDITDAPTVVLVNGELVRQLFAGGTPLGEFITGSVGSDGWQIVGVVEDVLEHGPTSEIPPTVYFANSQAARSSMALTLRTAGDPLNVVPELRRIVTEIDSDLPVHGVNRLDQLISGGLGGRRFTMSLLAVFAGVALTLGAVGIYGMMAYNVECRTREIGLRQALGASPGSVLAMVISQGTRTTLIGVTLGVVGAYFMRQSISSLLFEVSGFDVSTYAAVAGLLLFVAILACFVPARRAAAVDPMEALRQD